MRLSPAQWEIVQIRLCEAVGESVYSSWLKALRPASSSLEDPSSPLVLAVPTAFMRGWIQRNYADVIAQMVFSVTDALPEISLVVAAEAGVLATVPVASLPAEADAAPLPFTSVASSVATASVTEGGGRYAGTQLDPRFTFDTFVTGKSNEFAYAAARRIAESPEVVYNPFVLHGGVGLGKTHLMHAIAHYVLEQAPSKRVMYVSSEKFLHNFIRSMRDKNTASFKETFRNVDVLMVDDVQFIAGKEATQEEFFHTFNSLVSDRKQVVLTADRSPHEMAGIEDRLRSRLGWGLITEVHRPDLETRMAILSQKASELQVELGRDVALFLAQRIDSNVRELEGALNRLAAHSSLIRQEVTVASAQELLKDLFRACERVISLDEIQRKVAEFYNIKVADMHSEKRVRIVARPRQIAMYLAKTLTTKSFPEIGKAFGGRDHSTVIHGVKTIEKMVEADPSLREDLRILENTLGVQR